MLDEYNGQHILFCADLHLKSNLHEYSNKSHINLCEGDKGGGGVDREIGSHSSFSMLRSMLSGTEVASLVYVTSFSALGLFNLFLLIIHANSCNLGRSALNTVRRVCIMNRLALQCLVT